MREMKLKELKQKSPTELLAFAEENDVENASTMRKQELMFAILKQLASVDVQIIGAKTDDNRAYADKILRRIARVPGVADARIQQAFNAPTFNVDVDRTLAEPRVTSGL